MTSVADIDLTEESILLDPKTIFLGGITKATMNRFVNNGDITQATYHQFHKGVQLYYKGALDYIQRKFPISDPVICNSRWVDVLQRDKAEWNQVEFFIEKYSNRTFLQNIDNDLLFDEFVDYQSMCDDNISDDAWAQANITVLMSCGITFQRLQYQEHAIKGSNSFLKWLPLFLYYPTAMQVGNNYSVL